MRLILFVVALISFFDAKLAFAESSIDRLLSEIKSIDSDDDTDLSFLKKAIGNKRIVLLGESSHGASEFYRVKSRIAKFLIREMGFEVIAFESGIFECWRANALLEERAAPYLVRKCLMWELFANEEIVPLFSFAKARREHGQAIEIAGFDTEVSGISSQTTQFESNERAAFISKVVSSVDPKYGQAVLELE